MLESDVYRCQILTYEEGPGAERFKIQDFKTVMNKIRACFVENVCGSSAFYVLKTNICLGSPVGGNVDLSPVISVIPLFMAYVYITVFARHFFKYFVMMESKF